MFDKKFFEESLANAVRQAAGLTPIVSSLPKSEEEVEALKKIASATGTAVKKTAASAFPYVKAIPWILGGLAVLYVLTILSPYVGLVAPRRRA